MDGDLYDEFGNYLGSESEQEEDVGVAEVAEIALPHPEPVSEVLEDAGMPEPSHAVRDIVLHEDKSYYEDARQTFGSGVGALFSRVFVGVRLVCYPPCCCTVPVTLADRRTPLARPCPYERRPNLLG